MMELEQFTRFCSLLEDDEDASHVVAADSRYAQRNTNALGSRP